MQAWARAAVPAVAGYVLGSVPTADLVARRRHVALRAIGDRNPGWWNTKLELGTRAAAPVLVVDVAKGAAAAAIGRAVAAPHEWWPGYVGGLAAMIGHAWPVTARFRGGRSVATFGGAAGVLSPVTAVAAIAAGVVAGRPDSSLARGIQIGFASFPVVQIVVDGPRRTAATGGLMTLIGLRFWLAARRP